MIYWYISQNNFRSTAIPAAKLTIFTSKPAIQFMTILSYIFFQNSDHFVFELQQLHHTLRQKLYLYDLAQLWFWKCQMQNCYSYNAGSSGNKMFHTGTKLKMNYCLIITGFLLCLLGKAFYLKLIKTGAAAYLSHALSLKSGT